MERLVVRDVKHSPRAQCTRWLAPVGLKRFSSNEAEFDARDSEEDPPICLANPDLYVTKTPPKFMSPPSIMRRNWSELGHSSDIYVTNPEAVSESSDPQAPKLGVEVGSEGSFGGGQTTVIHPNGP
jgi:hypothetical protein